MHPDRPFVLFGAASVVAILSGSFLLHAYQAAAPKPNYDPPENLVRTDFPSWPYPRGIHDTRKDDGTIDRGGHVLLGSNQSWWQIARAAEPTGLKQSSPRLMIAKRADGLTLYKITLRNSPNFHVAVNHTDGFTVWGVTIDTPKTARNTDGIDPGTSTNVTITRSFIRTGDDNVAIKGGVSHISVTHNYFTMAIACPLAAEPRPPSQTSMSPIYRCKTRTMESASNPT